METSSIAYIQTENTAANMKGRIFANRNCAQPKNLPVFAEALLFLIGIKTQLNRSSIGKNFSPVVAIDHFSN